MTLDLLQQFFFEATAHNWVNDRGPVSEGAYWTCYASDGCVFGHIIPDVDGFRFVRREQRDTATMSYEEFQKYSGDLIAEHQRRKL